MRYPIRLFWATLSMLACSSTAPNTPRTPAQPASPAAAHRVESITLTSASSVGEGGDSKIELHQSGSFRARQGGGIGNGMKVHSIVEGKVVAPKLQVALRQAAAVVETLPEPSQNHSSLLDGRRGIIIELRDGGQWTTDDSSAHPKLTDLETTVGKLVLPQIEEATGYLQPTANHAVYTIEAKSLCSSQRPASGGLKPHCSPWPSRFTFRTDGVWQCQQARAEEFGAEVSATAGRMAPLVPPAWTHGQPSTGAVFEDQTWTANSRTSAEVKHYANEAEVAAWWKEKAHALSPLCWPLTP